MAADEQNDQVSCGYRTHGWLVRVAMVSMGAATAGWLGLSLSSAVQQKQLRRDDYSQHSLQRRLQLLVPSQSSLLVANTGTIEARARALSSSIIDVSLSDLFNTHHDDAGVDYGTYLDELEDETLVQGSERDWDMDAADSKVDTGGPFLGPQVWVEPRLTSTTASSQNFNNSANIVTATKRIIGGYEAAPHPFHSMLLLRYGGGWRWAGCGATLISNCHVLTAAHCAADPSKPIGAVFVNAHRPYQDNQGLPFHFSSVEHVTRHAGFNATTNQNDIAVIKMAQCLNSTEFPPAIPADPRMEIPSDFVADILGFGKQSEQGNMFVNVEALQRAQIPIISNQNCLQYYGDRIKEDMFCGGFAEGGVDACQGDSGSSMTFVREDDGSTVILGVISWGVGCGRSHSPGVYSSVQYHYDWIARQVCREPETNITWCSTYSLMPTASPSVSTTMSPYASSTAAPSNPQKAPAEGGAGGKRSNKDRVDSSVTEGFFNSPPSMAELMATTTASTRTISAVSLEPSHEHSSSSSISGNLHHSIASSSRQNHQYSPHSLQAETSRAHTASFWDHEVPNRSGCKPNGLPCWMETECCSGVCQSPLQQSQGGQIPLLSSSSQSALCVSTHPTPGDGEEVRNHNRARGVRIRRQRGAK